MARLTSNRCTKCGCFAVFLFLASLAHVTLHYKLHHCHDCSPQTPWLDSMSLELGVHGESLEWSGDQQPNLTTPSQAETQEAQRSPNVTLPNHPQHPTEEQKQVDASSVEAFSTLSFNISTTFTDAPTTMVNSTSTAFAIDSSGRRFVPGRWSYNRTAWRSRPDDFFNVRFPVFVASLPKSGTTSIYAYFLCGGARGVHTYCPFKVDQGRGQLRVGELMEENIRHGYPPFHGCGTGIRDQNGPVKVFSDTGYVHQVGQCYYPSISALEAMYDAYPNMTIVLGTRNSTKWYQSIKKWGGGSLLDRWSRYCAFMPNNVSAAAFTAFYEWHNQHIRKFVQRHQTIKLIEFSIDSETAGDVLESETNITSACWGHSRPVDSYNAAVLLFQQMNTAKSKQKNFGTNATRQQKGLKVIHKRLPAVKGTKNAAKPQNLD